MEQAEGAKVPLHAVLKVLRQAGFAVVTEIKVHSCCTVLFILCCTSDSQLQRSLADRIDGRLSGHRVDAGIAGDETLLVVCDTRIMIVLVDLPLFFLARIRLR